ncbi:MAG: S-methyl-5-thioribose-1-phosphate isomerase [Actinomycetaceae bacterium]|nr:S-methyl-5-thioribose-1-phosphate isomerase [Actinomycetaceae bacterium]
MVTAITWTNAETPSIRVIDQTLLPIEERYLELQTVPELVDAIKRLVIRGAPALGVAGAYGVALAKAQSDREGWDNQTFEDAVSSIRDARPTAVNLAWGVDQVMDASALGVDAVVERAAIIAREDEEANRQLSRFGADWLLQTIGKDRLRIVTHCNTGALATAGWGTAYGIIHELHQRGAVELVYADETRPLLQGSRLTAFELMKDGIPYVIEPDGAASSTILRGLADVAMIGADRIAANGDSANKIGSVALALAAKRAKIPFLVAAPFSTVDLETPHGQDIEIEERGDDEVLSFGACRAAPKDARAFNPAFDVTPHDLIAAIVTERGVTIPNSNPEDNSPIFFAANTREESQ